jgi:hypothetical protein
MSSRFTASILTCRVPASWLTVLLNISLIGPRGRVGYEPGLSEIASKGASYPGVGSRLELLKRNIKKFEKCRHAWTDRARLLTSSSNHARPRAIALISAGSHLELCFCGANPGRTNLVSAPRRAGPCASSSLPNH